jgi:hypothetical protein
MVIVMVMPFLVSVIVVSDMGIPVIMLMLMVEVAPTSLATGAPAFIAKEIVSTMV